MKAKKKGIAIIFSGAGIVLLAALFFHFMGDYEGRINHFVKSNETALEEIALDQLGGVETVSEYQGAKIEGVCSGEHKIVQFFSGGFGLVPSSTYYGFYYSEDDVPVAYANSNNKLTVVSDNEWAWDDGTDNGGITKKISEHWYYYEAWF